jgi:hypothetical protein
LNKINGDRWKTVPFTPVEQPFILFSELDLVRIFWSNPILKDWLSKYVPLASGSKPALGDIIEWLSTEGPGWLISRLLTDGPKSFNARAMNKDTMKEHLSQFREPGFDPRNYSDKGYAHYGSIRTDGFRLQVLSFKLRELNSVRYKRFHGDVLPAKITSTVGGVNYYLTEIRNVVKSRDDVKRLLECEPEDVNIIGLDLGQTCVVGASAVLSNGRTGKNGVNEACHGVDGDAQMEELDNVDKPEKFYNFVVTQKALYQSILKNRRWMNKEKNKPGPNYSKSIADIESGLPPRAGEDSDFTKYLECLDKATKELSDFYNGNRHLFKRRSWDARKAFEAEFAVITDRILGIVGGSIGRMRDESCKVVIALGLGKFSSRGKLISLHNAFMSYFVRKVTLFHHERDPGICATIRN